MSGMLPGVEAARRRRTHHRQRVGDPKNSEEVTKRFSACLYVANYFHEFHTTSILAKERKKMQEVRDDDDDDGLLDAAAREAKRRLDLRLQSHWKSLNKK